jgi:hypothetical protein
VSLTSSEKRDFRSPSGIEFRPSLPDSRRESEAIAAPSRGDARALGFLINADGTWLQLGTVEADSCIARCGAEATLENAIERDGFISVEYTKQVIRVRLNPGSVAALALTSLRPRLSVVDLPVRLMLRDGTSLAETCASGAIAMGQIEARVRSCRELATERFQAPLLQASRPPVGIPMIGAGSYVITHKGEWLREADPRLAAEIGFSDTKIDAVGFAVRNMGFVRVAFGDPGTLTIAFHPRNAEPTAINSLLKRIEAMNVRQIDIRFLAEDKWQSEMFTSGPHAMRRIRMLCGIETGAKPRERWHLTTVTPAALSKDDNDPLRLMHQKWRISFGTFSESFFTFAMRHGLLDRFILTGARRPDDELVFRYIGEDFATFYSEEFRFNAIGKSVLQQPDKDYGEWLAAAYKAVALSGTPRLDYIDAYLPGSQRGPWIRYERLLLPWKLPNGEHLVSTASRIKADRMLKRPD